MVLTVLCASVYLTAACGSGKPADVKAPGTEGASSGTGAPGTSGGAGGAG